MLIRSVTPILLFVTISILSACSGAGPYDPTTATADTANGPALPAKVDAPCNVNYYYCRTSL
jgi:hypothetical protein